MPWRHQNWQMPVNSSTDVFLFPLFFGLVETGKAKFMCACLASFALLCYMFGVVVSQPDASLSMGGSMLIKLSGESVFAWISLFGQIKGPEPVLKKSLVY